MIVSLQAVLLQQSGKIGIHQIQRVANLIACHQLQKKRERISTCDAIMEFENDFNSE
jgi:hypothetical protein